MSHQDVKLDHANTQRLEFLSRRNIPMTTAGAVGAGARSIQDDPQFRRVIDLRGCEAARVEFDFGGTPVGASKIEIQYHPGGDPNVASGDAGWTRLCVTDANLGGFLFAISQDNRIPNPARIKNCIVRPVYYDGDGVGNPQLRHCALLVN